MLIVHHQIDTKGEFCGETCIFDEVFDAIEGKADAICYLEFINSCLGNIRKKLTKILYGPFLATIEGLFIDFDDSKSRFRSRIGEIAVLSQVLSGNELVLKAIEYRLPNGKSIDYVIEHRNETFYFEVYNILNFDGSKIETEPDLKNFLEKRYQEKVNSKLNGLDLQQFKNFSLVSVLWGDLDCFQLYNSVLMHLKKYHGLIFPPFGIYLMTNKDGKSKYVINSIEKVVQWRRETAHNSRI